MELCNCFIIHPSNPHSLSAKLWPQLPFVSKSKKICIGPFSSWREQVFGNGSSNTILFRQVFKSKCQTRSTKISIESATTPRETTLWIGPVKLWPSKHQYHKSLHFTRFLSQFNASGCTSIAIGKEAYNLLKEASCSCSVHPIFKHGAAVWEFLKGNTLAGVAALDRRPNPDFVHHEHRWRMVQRSLVEAIIELICKEGKIFLQSDVKEVALRMKDDFLQYGKGKVIMSTKHHECNGEGWLENNPFSVFSDWEQHVIANGQPMYRVMLSKCIGFDTSN